MQFGEVIFGGVGSGLYGMLIMVIITVFIAGLMVGRTPEYLGKKIEMYEMKMAALVQCLLISWCYTIFCDRVSFMARHAMVVNLTATDRQELELWLRAHRTPQQVVQRCRIILASASGQQDKAIAKRMRINYKTAALWRKRFCNEGPDCLWEVAAGRGRKPKISAAKVNAIIDATLQSQPAGATQWSCRTMAEHQGVSKATINRIWQSHNIQPHRTKTFKLSRDPRFLEKLTDVVGLYLNPPEKALVLCVDEKSQIQALDRTQPGLPLKKGRCGTKTHDCKRNGTTTLFAALELAQGKVIGQCYARHRHQEFLKFLKRLDAEFPVEKQLHLVMDNYGTHKHPNVRKWLSRHPRFVTHFIPTGSSCLNLVERWFGELTGKRLRRGVFVSVDALTAAIDEYLATWNNDPKPLVWTATVDSIIEKLGRCKQTLEKIQPGSTSSRSRKEKVDNTSRL